MNNCSIKLTPTQGDAEKIQQLITEQNHEQKVRNSEKFGAVTNETVVITIQVHNRLSYLTHLIESLKETHDIHKALLIISHDVYDYRINELVEGIDFCLVMQIFYPYSIQTHTNSFPGRDVK